MTKHLRISLYNEKVSSYIILHPNPFKFLTILEKSPPTPFFIYCKSHEHKYALRKQNSNNYASTTAAEIHCLILQIKN